MEKNNKFLGEILDKLLQSYTKEDFIQKKYRRQSVDMPILNHTLPIKTFLKNPTVITFTPSLI